MHVYGHFNNGAGRSTQQGPIFTSPFTVVIYEWHYDNAYNDFTNENFTHKDNTTSPAIKLESFLFTFLLL